MRLSSIIVIYIERERDRQTDGQTETVRDMDFMHDIVDYDMFFPIDHEVGVRVPLKCTVQMIIDIQVYVIE